MSEVPEPPRRIFRLAEDDREKEHSHEHEALRWTLVGIDGACSDALMPLLARAGWGVFYGDGHSQNWWQQLYGPWQSAQRAEVAALRHVVATSFCHTHIICDNKMVVEGFTRVLLGEPVNEYEHQDLWQLFLGALRSLPHPSGFAIRWFRGHSGQSHHELFLASREEAALNQDVDDWAKNGAKLHAPSSEHVTSARRHRAIATVIQRVATGILSARYARLNDLMRRFPPSKTGAAANRLTNGM